MKLTKEQIIDVIMEGVDDPGILKCVFMAGGPGSGKSFTAKEIFGVGKEYTNSFSSSGLKIVNSDTAFEKGLKDNGIDPKDLGRIEKEEPELWDKITRNPGGIRAKAKALTQKQQAFYEQGRLGMIIDGTGDDFGKIKKKVERAKSLGYDCYMVFVNTSLEVALERNRNRDRTLSDELVTSIWKDVQQNLGKFQGLFGGNMVIVDNTVYKKVDEQVQKAVNRFIGRPIYNPIGKEWIKTAIALKKAKLIKAGNEMNNKPTIEEKINLFVEENVPTDPTKWAYAKSQAKKKFDVYPSAYANAWASKKYKELGGGWRKSEGVHSYSAMSATRAALKKRKKESVNEAGLKGTENIPSNKKLSQLSDNEKLNIIQSLGNIISFHIPDWAKGRYKFWQVISAGKIKKKKDLGGEIIYFLPGKGPQKASPTYKSVKDLINGIDWDTMEMRRESVNESADTTSLKKIHDAVFKFLKTKKGVGEVKEFPEFPNRYGDNMSTFSVKYNIEDAYNYDLQEIKIEYSTSRVFIPNKGYFPFKTFNDIKNIINKKSSLKESVNENSVDKLRTAVQKINKKYQVKVSTHPVTKGEIEIILGRGNHPDSVYHSIEKLVSKLGIKRGDYSILDESINEGVWTPEQERAVALLDSQFRKYLSAKGIEPTSIEASRAWKSYGFQDKMRKIFPKSKYESVDEGLFSDIMKGVKKGSSPYSLVVIVNNKVVKQVQVKEDKAIPAHFTTLKKEYPNSRIRVESSTGQILFEK
jgi:dephospho-CoA kinase